MNCGRIINCMQGDGTWLMERTGRVTASRVNDVVSKLKNGNYPEARQSYKMELLTEVLTGNAAEHFVSMAMDWGITQEPVARAMYELRTGVEVERIGLVVHPTIERSSASPDGTIGDAGLIEIKCPTTATHLQYVLNETIPGEYLHQCMWQLACTGREWLDFVSFDSRLPEDFNLLIVRMYRDDAIIAEMDREVEKFIAELNAMADKLLKLRGDPKPHENFPGPPKAEIPSWPVQAEAKK